MKATGIRFHHHSIAMGAVISFTSPPRRRHRCKFFSLETVLTRLRFSLRRLFSYPAVSAASDLDASSMSDTSVVGEGRLVESVDEGRLVEPAATKAHDRVVGGDTE